MGTKKQIVTTQSMLAMEVAARAVSARQDEGRSARELEQSTEKIRAHYAQERGIRPPEVTLEMLRQRQAAKKKA